MNAGSVAAAGRYWDERRFTRGDLAFATLVMVTFGTYRRREIWELFTPQGFDFEVKAKLLVWGVVAVLAVFVYRRMMDRSSLLVRMPLLPYVVFCFLAFVSVVYSLSPSLSFYRAAQLALLFVYGVAYAEKMEDWPKLGMLFVFLNWIFLAIGVTRLVPSLDLPLLPGFQEAGFNADLQPWRFGTPMGHFSQISIVAAMVAIALAARMRRETMWRDLFLIGWMVLTVGLTISRTAIMGLVLGLAVVGLLRRQVVPCLLGILVGGCLLLSAPSGGRLAVSFLDRGQSEYELESLTGRTDIYRAVFAEIDKRPVLGFGYRANRMIILGEQIDGSGVAHAHNAVLEATSGLGMGGGALAIAILVSLALYPAYVAVRESRCGILPGERRFAEFAGLFPPVICFSMLDSSFSMDTNPFILVFVAMLVDMAAYGKSLDLVTEVVRREQRMESGMFVGDEA